jgi:hypothetical protein
VGIYYRRTKSTPFWSTSKNIATNLFPKYNE